MCNSQSMRRKHYSISVKTNLKTNCKISVCLNWCSAESLWWQKQRRTSEGEGVNEILVSILWQHFGWLTEHAADMQLHICWTEKCCAAVIEVLRFFCGVCRAYLTRASQSCLASKVQHLFWWETYNQGSICKLVHLTPDYSLKKHWKLSL